MEVADDKDVRIPAIYRHETAIRAIIYMVRRDQPLIPEVP